MASMPPSGTGENPTVSTEAPGSPSKRKRELSSDDGFKRSRGSDSSSEPESSGSASFHEDHPPRSSGSITPLGHDAAGSSSSSTRREDESAESQTSSDCSCPCGGYEGPAYFNDDQGVSIHHAGLSALGFTFLQGITVTNRLQEEQLKTFRAWSLRLNPDEDSLFTEALKPLESQSKRQDEYKAKCMEGFKAVCAIQRDSCTAPGSTRETDCSQLLTSIWDAQQAVAELTDESS